MHINKQSKKLDILKLHKLNQNKIYSTQNKMTHKNKINNQNTKERKKTQKNWNFFFTLTYWMKLVVVAPSSSTCTREWGKSTNYHKMHNSKL
jgi:cytosine/uracil/thiamine/allantoin permease